MMLGDVLQDLLFPVFLALICSWVAHRFGFFKLPTFPRPPIFLPQLLSVFGIYLGYFFVLAPFLQILLVKISFPKPVSSSVFLSLQFFIALAMFLTILFYICTEGKTTFKAVFKNPESKTSLLYDFGLGMSVYLVAYPWVLVINRLSDFSLAYFFHFENYEQAAVRYLKENIGSPLHLATALFLVVIIAPCIEELLFRGALQQYLKRFISTPAAIALTSAVFALFHYSTSQQLGNLSIISSLFIFACFLGYTYERQGSLCASIGLHSTFNLASSLQILLGA